MQNQKSNDGGSNDFAARTTSLPGLACSTIRSKLPQSWKNAAPTVSAYAKIRPLQLISAKYFGSRTDHAVQEIGAGETVIHQIANWKDKPVAGLKVTVQYKDHQAEWEPKGVAKSRNLGR
jgi:hypothetical protein